MEEILWYTLASSRGGDSRARILRSVADRPRNPNQLADALDLDYTTVRHHLDVLEENNVLKPAAEEYGAVYLPTDQVRANWTTVEEILDTVEPDEGWEE
ncbi:MAG: winged helix-turn-helix domain-containing protein [Halobacteriales archaeon]